MRIVERHVLNFSNNQIGFFAGACALAVSISLANAQTAASTPAAGTSASTSAPASTPASGGASTAAPGGASTAAPGGASTALPRVNVVGTKPDQPAIPGGTAMPIRDAVVNAYLKIHREPIKEP